MCKQALGTIETHCYATLLYFVASQREQCDVISVNSLSTMNFIVASGFKSIPRLEQK